MSVTTSPRKYYASLDVMKFLMALSIMFAHICSENVTVHPIIKNLTSVYNFAVPFFFACSGFLFFLKYKNENSFNHLKPYKKFTKRILLMYAVWSAIYFCFVLTTWIQDGASYEEILRYFHGALVFTTYGTIWFLPSLWVGVSITFVLLFLKLNLNQIALIAFVFYIIGTFGFSYLPLIEGTFLEKGYSIYNNIFFTTRNGVFAGFPFVFIGALLAINDVKGKQMVNLGLTILFCALFVVEAVFIKNRMHTNVDMGLMLLPAIYFMMSWLIRLDLAPKPIYLRFRNQSMLIFLGQRIFITAIPSILSASYMEVITQNPYIGLAIFVIQILFFTLLIEFLSKKYQWLKILW